MVINMYKKKIKYWKYVHKEYKKIFGDFYKERKDDYITISILDNPSKMQEYIKKKYNDDCKDAMAYTNWYYRLITYEDNSEKISNNMGEIVFNLEEMTSNTVAHEVSHAILGYFNYIIENKNEIFDYNNKNYDKLNELFAYISGGLNGIIWDFYWKIKGE